VIYLDYNATSPVLPEVLDAMGPWLGVPANPASAHRAGQRAARAVERARAEVAALLESDPAGVVFTSGATEANHLFLRGVVRRDPRRRRVVVSPIEHPSVLAAAAAVAAEGGFADRWSVGSDGVVRTTRVPEDTAAVSLMAANHETGVLQPLTEALARAHDVGAALHVDATQAAGRIPLDVPADAFVLSSHKLGGPAGVGALVLRDGGPFPALLSGGAQERGRRAGTVNTAGVVGFGEACRLARIALPSRSAATRRLSDALREGLTALGGRLVGAQHRLPNTTCVVFPGLRGETIVQGLDLAGICASSGAACASGSLEPSPVLVAMGDPEPGGGVRFSLGWASTEEDVALALATLPSVLASVRRSGAW
jgi:cysteine desulfurase